MPWTEERKKAHAERIRESWADPEIRARRLEGMKVHQAKPETKAKTIARANSPEAIARVKQIGYANRGKVHSEEQNKNHGKIMGGRTLTNEHKTRISEGNKKYFASLSKEEREDFYQRGMKSIYKPTSIEREVGRIFDASGISYIRHPWIRVVCDGDKRVLRPDFVLPGYNLVVEVQGCYWHGCEECYGEIGRVDRRAEDILRKMLLEEQGYHVLNVWEHEIKAGQTLEILAKRFDER